ncbi:hypothetical protein DPM33_31520 [Mesorhizobium hawassense]|uniref:Uncharacterized protein n=1 Tax=Mesorhizobium hawassense TaxID=1209954 RepID=A0A330H6T4_9HYPH|nr:hypothetical protein [Mesorhizobium hawassense]RAZ84316.1 hypothetical protein DPM33_31520 [Mesorhizobium hawassense]
MASTQTDVAETAPKQDSFDETVLRNLTDEQLYEMANDLLAAQAVMRDVEAEWYGRRRPRPQ